MTIVHQQGCNIENFREMRKQKIREKAAELDHLRDGYQNVLHPSVKAVIGHLHLPLLDWLLREIGFEDEDYLASLMRGRPVLGQATDSSANVACWSPACATERQRCEAARVDQQQAESAEQRKLGRR